EKTLIQQCSVGDRGPAHSRSPDSLAQAQLPPGFGTEQDCAERRHENRNCNYWMTIETGSRPRFPTNCRGGPGEPVEPELAAGPFHLVRQNQLPAEVIADHPLLPERV